MEWKELVRKDGGKGRRERNHGARKNVTKK
jgi:hypothetical protein